jgi:hypothetical protein
MPAEDDLTTIVEEQLRHDWGNIQYNTIRNSTAVRIENYIQLHSEIKETAMTQEEAQLIAKLVAEQIKNDDVFKTNMMWELHARIDISQIADEIASHFNTDDVVNKLLEENTYASKNFIDRILRNDTMLARIRNAVHPIVQEYIHGEEMKYMVEESIERKSINMANETVSRVLRIISKRITEGSDV